MTITRVETDPLPPGAVNALSVIRAIRIGDYDAADHMLRSLTAAEYDEAAAWIIAIAAYLLDVEEIDEMLAAAQIEETLT